MWVWVLVRVRVYVHVCACVHALVRARGHFMDCLHLPPVTLGSPVLVASDLI